MADSNLNPGSLQDAKRVSCDPRVPCSNGPSCRWRSVGTCRYFHSESEAQTMQKRRGNGTEAKLNCLISQMEKLLHLLQETSKECRSHAQSGIVPDTRDTVRLDEVAKPIQAEVEAPPSGPGMEATQSKAKRVQRGTQSMTGPATSPKTWRRHAVNKGAGDPSEFAGPRDHTVAGTRRSSPDASADKGVFCWLTGEACASEPAPKHQQRHQRGPKPPLMSHLPAAVRVSETAGGS